jgi:signal transduction histidine kinase
MNDARKTLLIVEDTPENIDVVRGALGDDYRIKVALNGEKALALSQSSPPDLILLDIMMPDMDGYEVCRRLKEDVNLERIPVIFLTAKTEIEDEARGFALGAVDYITKPISPAIVKARVSTHLALLTQRKQIQDNYTRLLELETLRDNLVHMLVHDMRSPLMGISGFVQLARGMLSERQTDITEYLDEAVVATNELVDMVSELLDVSRLEQGDMPLEKKTRDVAAVIRDGIQRIGGERELVEVVVPANMPPIRCDGAILSRVVTNMVANALKFSPAGTPIVVSAETEGQKLRVAITDRGPGISAADQTRIFEKFGQVELRGEHKKCSSGLGLAFCKLAVEAHEGQIGVESVLNQGSTFWFTLPTG